MRHWSWLMVIMAVVAGGCGSTSATTGDRLTVVATTTVLGDVAANVIGADAELEILMPVGVDPHDFRASAAQVAAINEADLVIANGLDLEEGMEDVLDAAADDGVRILRVAELLDPIQFEGHDDDERHDDDEDHEDEDEDHKDDDEDHDDDHEHGSLDPHVWLDPLRMATAARLIAAELTAIDSGSDWSASAEEYAGQLEAADLEIVEVLSSIPSERRLLVTNHEALGYFADRYNFEVVGVVVPGGSTLAGPSSQDLAELVEVMEHEGVTAIYAETIQPDALAAAVAAELGESVQVVPLFTGSLGEPGSRADSLIGMLTTNAELIAAASAA